MDKGRQIAVIEQCERLMKAATRARMGQSGVDAAQAAFDAHARQHFRACTDVVDAAVLDGAHAAEVAVAFMRATPQLGHQARLAALRDHPSSNDFKRKRVASALRALATP